MGSCCGNQSIKCYCPSCGATPGINFKGSGTKSIDYICLKCGKKKSGNYYKCNICNSIFCYKCPFNLNNNNIKYSCPACNESAGENFKGYSDYRSYNCLKCGKFQKSSGYYLCKNCNGMFCYKCPQLHNENIASCPSCGAKVGINFKGSGTNSIDYNCLKCGKTKSSSYYKCFICNGIFCYKCPFSKPSNEYSNSSNPADNAVAVNILRAN